MGVKFSNNGKPKLIPTRQPEVFCPLCKGDLSDVVMKLQSDTGRSHQFSGIKKCKSCGMLFSYYQNLKGGDGRFFDIGKIENFSLGGKRRKKRKKQNDNIMYYPPKKPIVSEEINYLEKPVDTTKIPEQKHSSLTESEHKYSHTSIEESFIKINLDNLKH